ncbi:MAG TPA: DMT family transporter [Roseiarcus sp.]|nr:DMT family transporter [Roseiarcus sp.]
MNARPSLAFVIVHLLVASLLWASGFVFVKALNPVLAPFSLSAMRASLAALAIGGFIALTGGKPWPRGPEWGHWIALGAIQGWIPNVLTALGLRTTTAGLASMIQASGPLLVALAAHFLFKEERLTTRRAIGLAGVAGLLGPALVGDGAGDAAGAMYMVGVTVSYALAALGVRLIGGGDPLRLAFGQQAFSALPSIGMALAFDPAPSDAMTPLPLALWCLGIGVVATAAPMAVYMRLLTAAGPTRAALVYYLLPLWATILGYLFLSERITLQQALSGLVLLAGVWLATGRTISAQGMDRPAAPLRLSDP